MTYKTNDTFLPASFGVKFRGELRLVVTRCSAGPLYMEEIQIQIQIQIQRQRQMQIQIQMQIQMQIQIQIQIQRQVQILIIQMNIFSKTKSRQAETGSYLAGGYIDKQTQIQTKINVQIHKDTENYILKYEFRQLRLLLPGVL